MYEIEFASNPLTIQLHTDIGGCLEFICLHGIGPTTRIYYRHDLRFNSSCVVRVNPFVLVPSQHE
jgi:hypothetical protein